MEGIHQNKYIFISENENNESDLSKISEIYINDYSYLVLDHYDHNFAYQKSLRNKGIKWAQFDYKANKKIIANMVINGNISANKEMYKNIVCQNTIQCVGYKFAILRKDFINQVALPEKNRILIAMGGGQYPDEVIKMINLITCQPSFILKSLRMIFVYKIFSYTHIMLNYIIIHTMLFLYIKNAKLLLFPEELHPMR